jgi:hypothetical protein
VRHLDDDYVHRVVCVDTLFFTADDLAKDTPLNRDALVAFCSATGYGKGIFIKTKVDKVR